MKKTTIKLLLISAILISYLPVSSQKYQFLQKPKNQHKGFFLSMGLGVKSTNTSVDSKNYGYSTFKGTGGIFDLKIGGTIGENLILHATLLSHGVTGPKIDSEDWDINNIKTDDKISLSEGMIGAGLTYYSPANYFVSSSIGYGSFTFTNEKEDLAIGSDNGFGYQLKVGKEWWVSSRWGLGLAAFYHSTNVLNQEGNDAEEIIKSNNLGIVFSATFNGKK